MDPLRANFWSQPQSAAPSASAGTPGQAPPQGNPPAAAAAPDVQQQPSTPTPQPPTQNEDESRQQYLARIHELEQRASQAEQTASQLQSGLQEAIRYGQQRQQEDTFKRRRADLISQAEGMAPQERQTWLDTQLATLDAERDQYWQGQVQQERQQAQQLARRIGTPLFVDQMMRQHGLPEEARQTLMAYAARDPDFVPVAAQDLKRQYDAQQRYEQQLQQLSRSNQAQQMVDQGAGVVGGQSPAAMPYQSTGDADQDALAIYRQIKAQRAGTSLAPQ